MLHFFCHFCYVFLWAATSGFLGDTGGFTPAVVAPQTREFSIGLFFSCHCHCRSCSSPVLLFSSLLFSFSSLLFFLLCLFRWRIAYGPHTIASSKMYPSVYLCKDCFCRPEYSHFVRSVRKHESLHQEREEQEDRALQLEKEKKDGPATLRRSQSLDRMLQQAQKVLRGGCLCLFYDCCPRALCHFYFIFFFFFFLSHFFFSPIFFEGAGGKNRRPKVVVTRRRRRSLPLKGGMFGPWEVSKFDDDV